jgi:(1->4)-alpha-D-glucan 1-alpha-D-glucosylmutase
VGGDPDQFGLSPEDFHRRCEARLRDWPAGLSTTSTHDTKRSEDVRARIHVLSEMPQAWRAAVRRWHRWSRRHLVTVDGRATPDRNDEYLLYQTLVGAWPPGEVRGERLRVFTERIQGYMVKAAKEAKVHTSWINPSEAYDEALRTFVARVLDPAPGNRFLVDFAVFHEPIARLGMVNSLAQTMLKIAAPGVPDFYQGTEFWDLSLVDPDNRRPVDWPARRAALDDLTARGRTGDLAGLARELVATWPDGRIKLLVTLRALACRRASPELFAEGEYLPLQGRGAHGDHLCAFARRHGGRAVVVVAPRLTAALTKQAARLPLGAETWEDTAAIGPSGLAGHYVDVFTGAEIRVVAAAGAADFPLAALLSEFPVAMLAQRG